MFSSIISGAIDGISSYILRVETDISDGLPSFTMVGSVSAQVKEAGERVRVALKNSGYRLPPQRITVSFVPADIPKKGMIIDLPVAAGILVCMNKIKQTDFERVFVAGELSLDGSVRKIRGILPMVERAKEMGMTTCILPAQNASEGALVKGIKIVGVRSLKEFIDYINAPEEEKDELIPPTIVNVEKNFEACLAECSADLGDIHGQEAVKRVLEIAAAGFHNVLMTGPPGAGKSMMAKCLPDILPPLSYKESLEVTKIYSVAGLLPEDSPLIVKRPFVAPHHSVTAAALSGGGMVPSPGLVSLAHRSVLFLDELPEFGKNKLNILRQPLEDRKITVSRVSGTCVYPASFMLVAAQNPCPCGYYPSDKCNCTEPQILHYMQQVPGPIMDRIDLCVDVPRVDFSTLTEKGREESSASIRERVMKARKIQEERFEGTEFRFNSDMNAKAVDNYCVLRRNEKQFMKDLFKAMDLSARGYHRILKVARTIADLDGSEYITEDHLAEAVGYRNVSFRESTAVRNAADHVKLQAYR